ncbi:LysM peptidoglycan-binding domain-containing protein [Vibrio sp.]|nr:LysM peptidoglycan-binding domain-containing protein [Vibrio sp.]
MRLKYTLPFALLLSGCQTASFEQKNAPESKTQTLATEEKTPVYVSSSDITSQSPDPEGFDVTTNQLVDTESPLDDVLVNDTRSSSDTSAAHKIEDTPQNQEDVWQRIAMQMSLKTPNHSSVEYYRKWFLRNPSHMRTVAKRAEPFLYLITTKVEERGMPLELALLPVVESSFDAFAYSHGRAAGLWQFVPGTGKRFGLDQDFWYDGRRDVSASTDAALDYLTYLNKRFDGSWELAIAAYNSGGGRVSGAVKKNKRLGKPIDFFSLSLPKETSGYVPKLLALADLVANQEKYGINIPSIANKPVVQVVEPKEQLDLAIAANYAGISLKQLQSLNPAYNQWSTAPKKNQNLLLPIHAVDTFTHNLEKNKGKGVKTIRYKVKSGDVISVIAQKYQTTSQIIRDANQLRNNNIRVGQHLLIPTATKGNEAYTLSANNRLKKTQSKARGQYKVTHTVASGDSFWTIARKHKVSHQSLAKWNGMAPRDTLRIGQKLVVWKKGEQGSIIRTVYYSVRSGDSISRIASKFKVRSSDVVKWNHLNKSKYLQPGQKLKLYVDVTKVTL